MIIWSLSGVLGRSRSKCPPYDSFEATLGGVVFLLFRLMRPMRDGKRRKPEVSEFERLGLGLFVLITEGAGGGTSSSVSDGE
jgi:hypothetical protein